MNLKDMPDKWDLIIIGGGPAGLSGAYHLARLGYRVTVFEAAPEAGGMLRLGIPEYRLPRAILDRQIDRIAALGVEIRCSTAIGRDIEWSELDEFDAVFAVLEQPEQVLDSEIAATAQRHLRSAGILRRAGEVAPACGATAMSYTSPSSATLTITSALSSPKRKGDTMGQPPMVQKGRSRNPPSLPR